MGTNADDVKEVDPSSEKASLWEDFVDIFYTPSSVFARRSDGKFGMALLLLIVVGTVFDAKTSVAAAIMIATYSEVPRLVQILVSAAQGLFMSPEKLNAANSVAFNPARFMDPDHTSAVLIALASRVDLFTIWGTVLLAIGIHVVGKIPKQQAAIVAAITWVVGALPAVLGALRAG